MDQDSTLAKTAKSHNRALFVSAIILASLSLRPAMASLSPLIETIRVDLGLSFTVVGLLTSIPVLCLALFPFAANKFAARVGIERALLAALILITLATAVRWIGDVIFVLFASTFIVGLGVAGGQAYVPSIAKRHFGNNASVVTALYAATMSASGVIVVATTPYLANTLGGWTGGLAVWALPPLIAVIIWILIAQSNSHSTSTANNSATIPWRSSVGWRITAFSAVTFMLFFALLAWYPPVYQAQGWSESQAGTLFAVLLIAQLAGTTIVTIAAAGKSNRRVLMIASISLSVPGLVGVALAPLATPWIWSIAVGLGLGITFALALTLPVDYGASPEEVGGLTAMAMTVGYLIAAVAPVAIGWLRDVTGSFALPVILLAALVFLFTLPALTLPAPIALRESD